MSKVSVILTSYNHEKFIDKSIQSVLNQTFTDYELIIVDDYSTDKSWEIITRFNDPRIHAIRNPKNIRSEGIYNAIKNVATGKYIAIHHSDDLWEPTKLEKQVAFMEENPSYAACFTQVNVINEQDEVYVENGFYKNVFDQSNKSRYEWLNYFFYEGNALCHPSLLIRRKMYEECNLFDYGFANIPDFYKWIKLCMRYEIYVYPERLTRFRVLNNERNTSGDKPEAHIRFALEIYQIVKHYLDLSDEEFLKVFPSAAEYIKEKGFVKEFAFARLLIDTSSTPSYWLLGYTLLFDIVNNNRKAKLVEELYGYSYLDLIKETGKKDIFSVIPKKRYIESSIYLDYGQGYSDENRVSTSLYVAANNKFRVEFNLEEINAKNDYKSIQQIRFDPQENAFIKCKLEEVKIDDKIVTAWPYNALKTDDDGEHFLTTDPNYLIGENLKEAHIIQISGIIEQWNSLEVSNEIQKIYLELVSCRDTEKVVKQEKENYKELNSFYNKLKKEYQQLEGNYNQQVKWTNQISSDYAKLEDNYKNLEHWNSQLKQDYQTLDSKNEELDSKNKELENQNKGLENKNKELENQNKGLESKNEELENQNKGLESKNKELEQKIQELQEHNSKLSQELKVIEERMKQKFKYIKDIILNKI